MHSFFRYFLSILFWGISVSVNIVALGNSPAENPKVKVIYMEVPTGSSGAALQSSTVDILNNTSRNVPLEKFKETMETAKGDWLCVVYNAANYLVITPKMNLERKGDWLKKICDTLSTEKLPGAIDRDRSFLGYVDLANSLERTVAITAATPGQLISDYFRVVSNLVVESRETGKTLYEALYSISFKPGFATEPGAVFSTQLLGSAPSSDYQNWIKAKSFDESGNVISEGQQYYDKNGQLLQSQAKIKHRKDAAATPLTHVLATQPLKDSYGRTVATTMAAPTGIDEFSYKADFVQNTSGGKYNFKNFDRFNPSGSETDKTNNPDPVGGQFAPGTLGWYYSVNNDLEPYTPTTNYPFSRQTVYRDGTGNIKKSSGVGEAFKMGSGHEVGSYVAPVVNELSHYVQVRNKYFAEAEVGSLPTSLGAEAIQTTGMDANGREGVSIADKGGKVLMTARPGSGNSQTDIQVVNTADVAANGIFYFRIFSNNTSVSVSGAGYTLYDMSTEAAITLTGNALNKGYYKLVAGGTSITLTYTNWYTDMSYGFYNQLGQLVATIAPEGVKKLLGAGINNYATRALVPFISTYEYDLQGRLVRTTTPDEGLTAMVYRRDGKLRFSQNARQRVTGHYSYMNYDRYGRPVESGEYDGSAVPFDNYIGEIGPLTPMKRILEELRPPYGLGVGTRTDVVFTKYDDADNSHGVAGYTQDAAYLGGGVSMTRKYSFIVDDAPNNNELISAIWYNYDEEGKLLWNVVYVQGLGYKTTDFIYDALGSLVKKVYQKNAPDAFVHYYEYDPANRQLQKVYTNTIDNSLTKVLQATYIYYLHGPLKRVELGTNLQGIDYTYTLDGSLKAINNSDKTKDPGGDGSNSFQADAYGMVLDYFTDDYLNSRANVQPIKGVNTSSVTTDSYTGEIKAMSWFSKKPSLPGLSDNPLTYIYKYDDKYQFTESVWGNYTPAPNAFTTTNSNKETVKHPSLGTPAYDANGNIQYLQRTNGVGTLLDRLTYNYQTNTNKLTSVLNDASGTAQVYANYVYDEIGQLKEENTNDPAKKKYIKYDVAGKVVVVARDASFTQKVVEYVYNELGQRIAKKLYNASWQLASITYYIEDVVYTQDVLGSGSPIVQEYAINGGSGRLGVYYKQSNVYAYELNDHLGNVRAVIAKSGSTLEVRMYADYYPYGMVIQKSGDYRHGYQGQYSEKDPETDWNAFELRMYDSRIARWLASDPYGQHWSPYMSMGNDPANRTDADGGWDDWYRNEQGETFWADQSVNSITWNGQRYENIGESFRNEMGYGDANGKFTFWVKPEEYDYPRNGSIKPYVATYWQSMEQSRGINHLIYNVANSFYVTAQNLGGKQLAQRNYAIKLNGEISTPHENVMSFADAGMSFVPIGKLTAPAFKVGAHMKGVQAAGISGVYVIEWISKAGAKAEYVGKSIDIVRRMGQHMRRVASDGGTNFIIKETYDLPNVYNLAPRAYSRSLRQVEQAVIDSKGGIRYLHNKIDAYVW